MCGIAAVFTESEQPDLHDRIRRSLDMVQHRGPDGDGIVIGRATEPAARHQPAIWGLGHVRLAILDLTDAGRQPMSSGDGRVWISYNGEVYNYLELAAELSQLGHDFQTRTDTEVVLAAYQQWGEACVDRLRGMFAFVLVDLRQSTALIARDRLGIKPLYLWRGADQTVIVSELKQLCATNGFVPQIHPQQLVDYLSEGLLAHEPGLTMFQGVVPLAAGHVLSWPLGKHPVVSHARSFWEPDRRSVPIAWQDAVDRVGDLFRDSVRLRLRSDVPVGTCLSGGVDSSSIVGVAHHEFGAHMKTFSVCNNDPVINEQPYIDDVNRHCQTEPVKFFLKDDDADENFDRFVYHQDEPVFSLSQYGEFCVMRLARENSVPVLLNGQGGDETLCGYRKFAFFYLRQLLAQRRFAAASRHGLDSLIFGDRQLFQFWQGARYAPGWLKRRYDPLGELLRPQWKLLRRPAWKSKMQGVTELHEHQWADLRHWSLPVLLRYQDRNSMAHSVEARVPMVDHQFVELALTLPDESFFQKGMTKRVLVQGLGDCLPESIQKRRTKLGFDTPQARWLKGRLGERFEARVRSCERLEPILDREAACQAFQQYRSGSTRIPHFLLFRLTCLAVWLNRFQVQPS